MIHVLFCGALWTSIGLLFAFFSEIDPKKTIRAALMSVGGADD